MTDLSWPWFSRVATRLVFPDAWAALVGFQVAYTKDRAHSVRESTFMLAPRKLWCDSWRPAVGACDGGLGSRKGKPDLGTTFRDPL